MVCRSSRSFGFSLALTAKPVTGNGAVKVMPLVPVASSITSTSSIIRGMSSCVTESEDRELIVKWLPFMRCAARRRMKNDFDTFLRYLGEDGGVVSDPAE